MTARDDILGRRGRFLLELDLLGRVYRFADDGPVDVDTRDGRSARWFGGLVVGDVPRHATSLAVEIVASTGVDWAKLAAQGHDLRTGTARLLRWYDGQVLEEAEVLIVGLVADPEWGDQREGLTLSIVRAAWQDHTRIPAADARVSYDTWPVDANYDIDEPAVDATYPIVIGCPGDRAWGNNNAAGATPAYLVEFSDALTRSYSSKLLIAGHAVEASSVTVFDLTANVAESCAVQHTSDLLGRRVAYVTFTATTDLLPGAGHEYWVAWPSTSGGGVPNRTHTGPLRGLGELLVFLLGDELVTVDRKVRVPVDLGRQEAQRALLDQFHVDGAITAGVDVIAFIEAHLVPFFPIERIEGPDGLYYRAIRYDATAAEAIYELEVGRNCERTGRIRASSIPVYNRFRLDYAVRNGGKAMGRVLLTGDLADTDHHPDQLCAISQAREARRSGGDGVIEWAKTAYMVWEDATAQLAAAHLALKHAIPPTVDQVTGGEELAQLETGDVVLYRDAGTYRDPRVAIVRAPVYLAGGGMQLDLEILERPATWLRRTT